jgi:Fe-S-cluster containining protein
MEPALREIIERIKGDKKRLRVIFSKFIRKRPKELDALFHSGHTEFFQKNSCLTCANCCKTTSPIFRDVDIKRISKQLKIKESVFISRYLKLDEDSDFVLKSSPCVFLDSQDNTCSIYEFRPLACSEYPHTNRKNMHQILRLTERNAEICPAVANTILKFDIPS